MDMYDLKQVWAEESNVNTFGRIASTGAAAGLVTYAAKNFKDDSLKSWVAIGGAAYLLFRGMLGYCPVKGFFSHEYPRKPKKSGHRTSE